MPSLTKLTDKPYWITKESFLKCFDQDDFRCRKVVDVSQAYLSDWFYKLGDKSYFYLPTVTFISGKTQFINGRHRTAVILPHLKELPMAIALSMFGGNDLLNSLDKRPLKLDELIELPDFSIETSLP